MEKQFPLVSSFAFIIMLVLLNSWSLYGQTPVTNVENGVTQILVPGGAAYSSSLTQENGAIKITLPVLYNSTHLKFRLEVFNYRTDESFSLMIAGYNYSGGGATPYWTRCSAQLLTSRPDWEPTVTYGDDGSNTVIWIGSMTDVWYDPDIRVVEVMTAGNGGSIAAWSSGWSIGIDPSDFKNDPNNTIGIELTNILPIPSKQISPTPIVDMENNVAQILLPEGAAYSDPRETVNGAIKITLPVYQNRTFLKFRLEVYNYRTDESFSLQIIGYNFSDGRWIYCSAQLLSTRTDWEPTVSYGDNGTNDIIWVGDLTETWHYLAVRVVDVMIAGPGGTLENWSGSWAIELDETDFTLTNQIDATVNNVRPYGRSLYWEKSNGAVVTLSSAAVGIGTSSVPATYQLAVDGKGIMEELKVRPSNEWADYVFDPDYDLTSLEELSSYIQKERHLPGIPSAKEVKADGGIELGEMNRKLLEKIEELTLHLIDQNEKIKYLEAKVDQLTKE